MKINFGCGRNLMSGFFNIDAVQSGPRAPDLLYAARFDPAGNLIDPVPLPAGGADELHAYHLIEHVYAWEAPALIVEWSRLLKPGGLLILELPNILHAARNLLEGTTDQLSMWPLYGDWNHKDPYMMHKHGYTPQTITALLSGFTQVRVCAPQTHGARTNRDMRVEAVTPC